jgi:hypothetical protein
MSRVGTYLNLEAGGTYDLLLVKFKGTYPEGQITFGIYDTPMKITGIQKVAQVFLKTLFTSKGSDPFYPNKGTRFLELTVGANKQSEDAIFVQTLRDQVAEAETQVKSSLNSYATDTSSALSSVQVLGVDYADTSVYMYLSLTTLAGESASIAMPFPEFGIN